MSQIPQVEIQPARSCRDTAGRFLPGHPIGENTRWRNTSGNPLGVPRARRRFEEAFYAALMGEGAPEEAARLLWAAARNKEPWAIQTLLSRLAPQPTTVKLQHEAIDNNGGLDFSRLSDADLRQLEGIFHRAAGPIAGELESGALPAQPA